MKKLLLASLLLLAGSVVFADTATLPLSSFTKTNDNGVYISSSGYLSSVTVGIAAAGGTLVIYNSTWTTNAPVISSISLGTVFQYEFNDQQVAGIYYVTNLNANGVTIQYKKK